MSATNLSAQPSFEVVLQGATAALIKDGWHPHTRYPGMAMWNSMRAYTTDAGDTFVDHVNTKWVVQFPSDVPIKRVVAAANALAGRQT